MTDMAWAQGGVGASPPALVSFLPLLLVFVVFYFLLIRPQQQKTKEHGALLENLKRNDDVITSGGLYGKVMALEPEIVTLEIAPNVKVRVSRAQITTVLSAVRADEK
jgi:preprotein translocase subunit YajC